MTLSCVPASVDLAGLVPVLLVGIGGAGGAIARFAIAEFVSVDRFPVSIVAVNALGTFLAVLVVGLDPDSGAVLLGVAGFCGSLTTFSSFSVQTVSLWNEDRPAAGIAFATGTLLVCLLAAGLATGIVRATAVVL